MQHVDNSFPCQFMFWFKSNRLVFQSNSNISITTFDIFCLGCAHFYKLSQDLVRFSISISINTVRKYLTNLISIILVWKITFFTNYCWAIQGFNIFSYFSSLDWFHFWKSRTCPGTCWGKWLELCRLEPSLLWWKETITNRHW